MSKIVEVHERQPKIVGPWKSFDAYVMSEGSTYWAVTPHPDAPVREYGATYRRQGDVCAIIGGPFWDDRFAFWRWAVQYDCGYVSTASDESLGAKVEPAPETVEVPREELAKLKARIEELEAGR